VKETDPLVQKMAGLDGRDIRAWLVHREDRVSIDERERERERVLLFSFQGMVLFCWIAVGRGM
jgi:hypothetical protein